jgi:hypothetical protein
LAKSWLERRETDGFGGFVERMCLELVKSCRNREDFGEVTSQDEISIQLESLILAQNERWRQA